MTRLTTDSFVLRNGTFATVDPERPIVEGDMLVVDGEIRAIGEVDEADADGVREIDLDGKAVMPGFVQPHIHLCQTLLRGSADDMVLIDWLSERVWPYEAALDAEAMGASARLGLAELILGGTTALLDMGSVRHTDAIGRAVDDSGIRALIGKCMMDRGEDAPEALIESTDEAIAESIALCRRWNGAADGRIGYAFAPRFAVSCTEELLRRTAEVADEMGVPIHTHASETAFENEFAGEHHGMRNIPFLDEVGLCGEGNVFAHGIHVTDDECETLAETGTAICHCPSSNLKLASGVADMLRYDDYGVQVALGADGAPCNNNLDGFTEMRLAALIQKPEHGPEAMPARRVLRLATLDGAKALGIDEEVGSLEVGKRADLVVLDLDGHPGTAPSGGDFHSRIVYSAQRDNVEHVFCDGRQLVADGELVDWELSEILAEAQEAWERLALGE